MIQSHSELSSLGNVELLARTSELVGRSCILEAELLAHLGEIDERKLYLDRAWPSMFAFCQGELGFSEDVACNRITVARAARKMPAIIEAVRDRRVHLAGLRVLAPLLTEENHRALLAEAAGKPRRDIDEIAARLAPKPDVPAMIRKLPKRGTVVADPSAVLAPAETGAVRADAGAAARADTGALARADAGAVARADTGAASRDIERSNRSVVAPLSAERFKVQFTAGRPFKEKLKEVQDLLRHRFPGGDMEEIFGAALDLLLEKVKKERFAVGARSRGSAAQRAPDSRQAPDSRDAPDSREAPDAREASNSREAPDSRQAPDSRPAPGSRHVPAAMQRAVYERDEGRCAFVDERGRRCGATSALQIDHVDGYARTLVHSIDALRLLCAAHNRHAAEKLYGRDFMERARAARPSPLGKVAATIP